MTSFKAGDRTPHQILGIAGDATCEQVEEAYLFLVATYGGDSIASYQAFEEDAREQILEEIEGAYQALKQRFPQPESRGGKSPAGVKPRRTPPGSGLLRRMTNFLRPDTSPKPIPRKANLTSPGTGLSPGETLRCVRKARGLSLQTAAASTRIKTEYLEALEGDAFDRLPAGAYRRLMLISYARFLNLRPESLLDRYCEEER